MRDGKLARLTHDGKAKDDPALSPSQNRIAYFEQCPEQEHCTPSIVVLDLEGNRQMSIEPLMSVVPPAAPCGSIVKIEWTSDDSIAAECHLNPSSSEYVDTRLSDGKIIKDLLGLGFTRSSDGKEVAHGGATPHFAPPFAKSDYLQFDGETIYPLPKGARFRAVQGALPNPPDVVQTHGLTYSGIHEFGPQYVWSPDSKRVALIDCTYDWTANRAGSLSEADGVESNRRCALVVAARRAEPISFPIDPKQASKAVIEWSRPDGITVRAAGYHLSCEVRDALICQ